jgi:hypothetical protein
MILRRVLEHGGRAHWAVAAPRRAAESAEVWRRKKTEMSVIGPGKRAGAWREEFFYKMCIFCMQKLKLLWNMYSSKGGKGAHAVGVHNR